jgi:hypothetical protein
MKSPDGKAGAFSILHVLRIIYRSLVRSYNLIRNHFIYVQNRSFIQEDA